LRREFAPLFLMALRASGGSGAHAAAAREIVLFVLIAEMLAASQHDGPPHASARAPLPPAAPRLALRPPPPRMTMDLMLIDSGSPTEVRTFEKGRFEVFRVGPMTLGRATYEPGWKWSEHVGEGSCQVEHVGLVLSGQAAVKMDDGTEKVMRAGEFFYVPPGHDSWVVGDEPYVSLHIMGSEDYAS
jgi:quercetin dioxygenase-like cupin family protein